MNLKQHLLSLCIVALLTSPVLAKDFSKGTGNYLNSYMEKMTTSLNLSPEQSKQIQDIIENSRKQVKKEDMDKEHMAQKWKEIKVDTDQKIKQVLTEEQKKKFDDFQNSQKKSRGHHMKEMMLKRLVEKLDLSDTQKQSVEKSVATFQEGVETILSQDKPLSKEDKEKIRELSKKRDEEIKSILTEDQKQKFKKLRGEIKSQKNK